MLHSIAGEAFFMEEIISHISPQEKQQNCTVLIVDDLFINRQVTKIMLKKNNFNTLEAENGIEAIEQFRVNKPDIILMDICMPEMGGLMAMQKIRSQFTDDVYPIIAFTSGDHQNSSADLLQKGFSAYLRKPFKEEELVNALCPFLTNGDKKVAWS